MLRAFDSQADRLILVSSPALNLLVVVLLANGFFGSLFTLFKGSLFQVHQNILDLRDGGRVQPFAQDRLQFVYGIIYQEITLPSGAGRRSKSLTPTSTYSVTRQRKNNDISLISR